MHSPFFIKELSRRKKHISHVFRAIQNIELELIFHYGIALLTVIVIDRRLKICDKSCEKAKI